MSDERFHSSLRLENFTAFRDAEFRFVKGVNVLVGENGAGKSHVLKALYAYQKALDVEGKIEASFEATFQVSRIESLVSTYAKRGGLATVSGAFGGIPWQVGLQRTTRGSTFVTSNPYPPMGKAVFIPAVDMMGYTRRFLAAARNQYLDFDSTYLDLVAALTAEPSALGKTRSTPELADALGGELDYDAADERFYLTSEAGRLPMQLVAEGLRKIATLSRLVQNGMIEPGSTLYWDEPEVNLNPVLMDNVVRTLFALARTGVQVFLATHSYVVLKELETEARPDDALRFFSLQRTGKGTEVNLAKTYLDLEPNPIERHYGDLYDRGLQKRIKEVSSEARVD